MGRSKISAQPIRALKSSFNVLSARPSPSCIPLNAFSMAPNNIVMVGFMGSGKSSIGRILARRLGYRFIDTDRKIIEREGMEISEIFALHGEEYFRERETDVLRTLHGKEHCVIATGGGIVLRENNRSLLRDLGFVVGLTANQEVIFERVSRNTKRPLLRTPNPRETIQEMLAARSALYEAAAEFTVDTSLLTHEQVAECILTQSRQKFPWPKTN